MKLAILKPMEINKSRKLKYEMGMDIDQCLRRATAESTTKNTKMTAAIKEPTTAPLTRWQKSVNCWQIANQLVLEFPLWAKYTMAAAAAAAAVVKANATCFNSTLINIGICACMIQKRELNSN